MPPKGKKSKAEEALAFLDDLDNLEAPPAASESATSVSVQQSARPSTDSARKTESTEGEPAADKEAEDALAFLESQIKQKRAPLSVGTGAGTGSSRTASPQLSGPSMSSASKAAAPEPAAPLPGSAPAPSGSFWGMSSSLWSSASSALQSAQRVAEEQYSKVKTEGVSGLRDQLDHLQVGGVDLARLRKDAEERIGAAVKGVGNVDLEKLRSDLLNQAGSTFTTLINTVAPPISAHETIELWFSHTMVGYDGVEGVVYRAWTSILEQTESGELVIVWSPPNSSLPEERTLNPVDGWEAGWESAQAEVAALRGREEANLKHKQPEEGKEHPVTTIPVFLQLQPVLAPLPIPQPPLHLSKATSASQPQKQLYFVVTLQDPVNDIQFTSVSQPAPADWLEVAYERSDWVEERLVDVIRTSVEVLAQDYVSTRMGLKPSSTVPATPAETESGMQGE